MLAHLQKPIRSRKPVPDPTLLTELVGLRQLTASLFSALASPEFSTTTVQQIVKQADQVKEGKRTIFCGGWTASGRGSEVRAGQPP